MVFRLTYDVLPIATESAPCPDSSSGTCRIATENVPYTHPGQPEKFMLQRCRPGKELKQFDPGQSENCPIFITVTRPSSRVRKPCTGRPRWSVRVVPGLHHQTPSQRSSNPGFGSAHFALTIAEDTPYIRESFHAARGSPEPGDHALPDRFPHFDALFTIFSLDCVRKLVNPVAP